MQSGETMVQRLLLTDEQLWRAIAENTDAMSVAIDQQLEFAAAGKRNIVVSRENHTQLNAQTISNLARQYQVFTAELRRRYS
jgi:hypothetical protein